MAASTRPQAGLGPERVERVRHEPLVGEEVVPGREPVVEDERRRRRRRPARRCWPRCGPLNQRCGNALAIGWSTLLGQVVQTRFRRISVRSRASCLAGFAASAPRAGPPVVHRRAVGREQPLRVPPGQGDRRMERRPTASGIPYCHWRSCRVGNPPGRGDQVAGAGDRRAIDLGQEADRALGVARVSGRPRSCRRPSPAARDRRDRAPPGRTPPG